MTNVRFSLQPLALILTLVLVACGGGPPATNVVKLPGATPSNAPTPTAQTLPTVVSTETSQPSPTSAQTPVPARALLFEYTRSGGIAGFCDRLQVFTEGALEYESTCRGQRSSARLPGSRIQPFRDWAKTIRTFQRHSEDNPGGVDNLVTELRFYGQGDADPTADQTSALEALATALIAEYRFKATPNAVPTSTATPYLGGDLGYIVFTRPDGGLYARQVGTGKESKVIEGGMRDFNWQRVGARAAMVKPKGSGPGGEIWTVRLDGEDARPLTSGPNDAHPRWSPDYRSIVYEHNVVLDPARHTVVSAEIWIMESLSGKNAHKLADGFDPVWSPDGKRIAYATNPAIPGGITDLNPPQQNGIAVMDTTGQNQTMLVSTKTSSGLYTPMQWSLSRARILDQPQWSPEGDEITFRAVDGNGAYLTTDASKGGVKQFVMLFFDDVPRGFSYSPNRKYITLSTGGLSGFESVGIFQRGAQDRDGYQASQILETLGRVPRNTGEEGLNVDGFAWSPDGTAIAYALSTLDRAGHRIPKGIWIFNVGGSDNKQVIPDGLAPVYWIP